MSGDADAPAVTTSDFGTLPDGRSVERYELTDGWLRMAVITVGGTVTELHVPDVDGTPADVVLGFADLSGYLRPHPYLGALIGRYANRIARGRFVLDGRRVELETNDGPNHLHGGSQGYHTRLWRGSPLPGPGAGVRLALDSPDGEAGYPGSLHVEVDYRLADGSVVIDYRAVNTEPDGGSATVVNLTNHTYVNLAGEGSGGIGGHVVEVPASRYTSVDPTLVPTGELAPVAGTPMDLRTSQPFSTSWDAPFEQLVHAGGYDHNWVLDDAAPGERLALAGRVGEPDTGRVLEVWTDQPGVQVYTGNQLTSELVGKGGRPYGRREGFCLETQHFPDSPNQPHFPSTVLRPGQTFTSTTAWRFPHLPR